MIPFRNQRFRFRMKISNDLKSYPSRYLNRMGLDQSTRTRWTRHRRGDKMGNVLLAFSPD